MDYIVLSIPVFFILIGLELLIGKLRKTKLYRFNDAVANISCGIAQQVSIALSKTVLIVGYLYLYENFRIFNISENWLTWILLFLGVDFCYYWFHRLSHEINIFWGAHIVHHQSEEYNLSVALRQSAFQGFISMLFYLPLAIIGFNPVTFVTINALQTLYQFWIHTKTIHKLHPAFEFLFNTPSHHRVHHGRNPKYLDKNHGGTLIIFDRMFGTFQPEEEEVVYGVTKPLASWNPVWANFDYYADLGKLFLQPMRGVERIKLLFASPGWLPASLGGTQKPEEVTSKTAIVYETKIPNRLSYYVLVQYAIVLLVTTLFLFQQEFFSLAWKLLLSAWIILSIANLGGIFELKKWVKYTEPLRLIAMISGVILLAMDVKWITITSIIGAASCIWIFMSLKTFKNYHLAKNNNS